MGNTNSKSSGDDRFPRYLGNPRLPHEILLIIAKHLCPHCCVGADIFLSTQDARKLQYGLGSLAASSRYLYTVANEHRFHSFIQPFRPDIKYWPPLGQFNCEWDIKMAAQFRSRAFPELLERLIQDKQLSQNLRYVSIRDLTLTYKAGITKRRLQLLMDASSIHGIQPPNFVPALLAEPVTNEESLPMLDGLAFWVDEDLWLNDSNGYWGRCEEFDLWLIKLLLFGLAPRLKKLLIDGEIAGKLFNRLTPVTTTFAEVTSLFIAKSHRETRATRGGRLRTETLLLHFPNLHAFQNNDPSLTENPVSQLPGHPPPLFPNLHKLTLAAEQFGGLQHVTQVLHAFPRLEELVHHRLPMSDSMGLPGRHFCNANVFDGVHHCLRKLTYSSTAVRHYPRMPPYSSYERIEVLSYEESRSSDVPHFNDFEVLEDLTIDQSLLGRLSPTTEHDEPQIGPQFPELSWILPQSLRHLTIQFVYNRAQIAAQLRSFAVAKAKSGRFPHLRDIYLTFVEDGTHTFTEDWVPQLPLPPKDNTIELVRESLMEVGVHLWCVAGKLEAPPGEPEEHPRGIIPAGTVIKFFVEQAFFRYR